MSDRGSALDAAACRQVWINVLLQAARDIFGVYSKHGAIDMRTARSWIGSRDFHMVCHLAGMDGTRVEQQLRRQMVAFDDGKAGLLRDRLRIRSLTRRPMWPKPVDRAGL